MQLHLPPFPKQESKIVFQELLQALSKIPFDQGEALLVGMDRMAYKADAELRVKIGTVESRVNRARIRLVQRVLPHKKIGVRAFLIVAIRHSPIISARAALYLL